MRLTYILNRCRRGGEGDLTGEQANIRLRWGRSRLWGRKRDPLEQSQWDDPMPGSASAFKPPGSREAPGPLRQAGSFQAALQLPGPLWQGPNRGKKSSHPRKLLTWDSRVLDGNQELLTMRWFKGYIRSYNCTQIHTHILKKQNFI